MRLPRKTSIHALTRIAAGASLVFAWSPLRAEPGPVIGYLMNSPASVFSFGMYQLRLEVEKSGLQLQRIFRARVTTSASYDWDRNRIRIAYVVAAPPNTAKETNRKRCSALINAIKKRAGIDPATGKPLRPSIMPHSRFAALFQEIGFEKDDAPKGYERKIDLVTEIAALVGTDKQGKRQSTAVNCQAALTSPKVLFR